ncbi:MAG: fluoride efflux transporter CrcB [Pyrinomonadaceae bacterium]
MTQIMLVGLGGFLGSIGRYLVGIWLGGLEAGFPVSTFVVNILGCLLIGVFAGAFEKWDWLPESRLFVATGFCGGFTTFSAFAFENVRLMQDKDYVVAALYIILSVTLGIAATFAGLAVSRS